MAMLRLVLIFIIVTLMVMDVDAQERRRGDGDGARSGGDTTIINNYGNRDRGSRGWGRDDRRAYHSYRRPGYQYRPGWGWYDPSAVIGGAIGGWLWRQWAQPEPVQEPGPVGSMAYCINRYKSYDANPRSPTYGTYLGYDGQRHGCP